MDKVSIIIAGRTEKYFQRTVDSVLDSAVEDIEVICIVDSDEAEPYLHSEDPRVKIIRLEKSIGQRAGYNLGVRESTGKYLMKLDAHALLSKGFDVELKKCCGEKDVVLPEMRRLDVHSWTPKRGGETLFMYFGLDMYCHYWPQYKDRATGEYPETLTGQGSCWFITREWNDYIGLLDEKIGSWGNVGIEVSLRTWLCGGRQIACPKCWQAHYFRKDDGGFPYPQNGRNVAEAHRYVFSNYYFKDNAFKNQCRPFKWLIDKFKPLGWEAYMVDSFKSPRVIVYYTDSQLEDDLAKRVRKRIKKVCGPIPIISVSQKPLNFGKNICIGEQPRKYKSVYEAMLTGVKAAPENSIVYLIEHDVFYHPAHFAFLPPEKGKLYFNLSRYYFHRSCDTFLKAKGKHGLSQGIAYREDWITHAEERLATAEDNITEYWEDWEKRSVLKSVQFEAERPNVDMLHDKNLTLKGSSKKEYIAGKKKGIKNLPGWGRAPHFLKTAGGTKYIFPATKTTLSPSEYLQEKFKRMLPQVSPVRCRQMKRESLPDILRTLGYKKGAEIGVRKGQFSEVICKKIPEVKMLCIDMWGVYYHFTDQRQHDKHFEEAKSRLAKYNVTFINKSSMEAAREVADDSLDFVYIDADHRFDWVMEDLITWSRKVRPGGIVSGHDYYRFRNAGVVPAVDVYTYQHGIDPWFITDEKEASFFWVKR